MSLADHSAVVTVAGDMTVRRTQIFTIVRNTVHQTQMGSKGGCRERSLVPGAISWKVVPFVELRNAGKGPGSGLVTSSWASDT